MPYFECPKTNKTECRVGVVDTDLDSCSTTINRISSRSSPRRGKGRSQRRSGRKMEDGGAEGVPVPFNRATMAYPSLTDRSRKSEAPSQQPSPPHRSSVSKPPDKTTIGGEVNGIAKFRVHVTWFSSRGGYVVQH